MLPKLHVRKATLADVDLLERWRAETAVYIKDRYGHDQWQNHYSRERLTRWIDEQATELMSFEEDGEPVGTITTSLNGDIKYWTIEELLEPALYLYRINVPPAYMGKRVGQSMIRWAEQKGLESAVSELRTEAWKTAKGLHSYYETLGFTQLESRRVQPIVRYRKPNVRYQP